MRIAVTGAGGFIGRELVRQLSEQGHDVVPIVRLSTRAPGEWVVQSLDDLTAAGFERRACDAVVHLAARAHITTETAKDPLSEFRKVNTDAAGRLAREASVAGVKRFIFMSTIGVNGSETRRGQPFEADGPVNPEGPYALSKWEAEQRLWQIADSGPMDLVVIRPPLVYGDGSKGRFEYLIRWIRRGWPLPFGLLRNSRSFVALDNLVDFVRVCLAHPAAGGQTFLASDVEKISTREFAALLARKLGKRPFLLPVPPLLMSAGAKLLGKDQAAKGLLASLEISLDKNREVLGWTPPIGLDLGMERALRSVVGPAGAE